MSLSFESITASISLIIINSLSYVSSRLHSSRTYGTMVYLVIFLRR